MYAATGKKNGSTMRVGLATSHAHGKQWFRQWRIEEKRSWQSSWQENMGWPLQAPLLVSMNKSIMPMEGFCVAGLLRHAIWGNFTSQKFGRCRFLLIQTFRPYPWSLSLYIYACQLCNISNFTDKDPRLHQNIWIKWHQYRLNFWLVKSPQFAWSIHYA